MIKIYTLLLLFVSLVLLSNVNGDALDTSVEASVAVGNKKPLLAYYSIRRDVRKCAYPLCGGYFIKLLNQDQDQIYVATVAFDSQKAINKSIVLESWERHVIAFGYTRASPQKGFKELVVRTAHVGMEYEGIVAPPQGKYYFFKSTGIMCVKAPCPSTSATELNTGKSVIVSSFSESYNENVHRYDGAWAISRVYDEDGDGHAIVQMVPSSEVQHYTITRIYIQVPDPIKPCPKVEKKCGKDLVDVYNRDTDRCLVWRECVKPGVCILSIPVCQDGWRLYGFPSLNNGCHDYYCDPDFTNPSPTIK